MNTTNKKIFKHLVALSVEYSKMSDYTAIGILHKGFLENPDNNQYLDDLLCIAFKGSRDQEKVERGKELIPIPIESEQSIAHTEQRLGTALPQDLKDAYLEFGCPYFFMNTLSPDNSLYGNSLQPWLLRECVNPLIVYLARAYFDEDIDEFYADRFDNDIEYIQEFNRRFIAFGLFFEAGEKFLLMLWDIELQKYALFPFYQDDWDTMANLLKSEYSVYDTFEDMVFNLKPALEKKYYGQNFP